jgi:hypothetical protein
MIRDTHHILYRTTLLPPSSHTTDIQAQYYNNIIRVYRTAGFPRDYNRKGLFSFYGGKVININAYYYYYYIIIILWYTSYVNVYAIIILIITIR